MLSNELGTSKLPFTAPSDVGLAKPGTCPQISGVKSSRHRVVEKLKRTS